MISKKQVDDMLLRLRTISLTGHDSLQSKCMDASYIIQGLFEEVKQERSYKESYLANLNTIFATQANQTKQLRELLVRNNKQLKKFLTQKR